WAFFPDCRDPNRTLLVIIPSNPLGVFIVINFIKLLIPLKFIHINTVLQEYLIFKNSILRQIEPAIPLIATRLMRIHKMDPSIFSDSITRTSRYYLFADTTEYFFHFRVIAHKDLYAFPSILNWSVLSPYNRRKT